MVLTTYNQTNWRKGHGSVLSREGFSVMADMAHEEGVFQEIESKVIKNLLNF